MAAEQTFAFAVQPSAERPKASPFHVVAPSVLLPRAVREQPYRAELRMAGGHPPYQWQLVNGKLPSGVTWSPQGIVHGTPKKIAMTGEDFSFAMRARDSAGRQVVQQFTLAVSPPEKSVWQKRLEWVLQMAFLFFLLWCVSVLVRWLWLGVRFLWTMWRERSSYR